MPWAAIIEMILKLIENCNKVDGREKLFQRLRHPGLRERLNLRAGLKRQGLRGTPLQDAVDRAMDDLDAASDDEINELIDSLDK
jgi:hypothetical protein